MGNKKLREFAVGAFFLLVGIGYLYLTSQIPRKQFIDAAFVPYVLATIMCLLGAFQLRAAARLGDTKGAEEADEADYGTVAKTLGLIVAYAAFLEIVGFPVMTVVYLFAQFIVLTPSDQKVRLPMYATVAVVTSAVVYLLFRHGFDMLLPLGVLSSVMS